MHAWKVAWARALAAAVPAPPKGVRGCAPYRLDGAHFADEDGARSRTISRSRTFPV